MCKCLSHFYLSTLHNKSESLFYNSREEKSWFHLIHFTTWKCYQVTAFISWFTATLKWQEGFWQKVKTVKRAAAVLILHFLSKCLHFVPFLLFSLQFFFHCPRSFHESNCISCQVLVLYLRFIVASYFARFCPLIMNLVYFLSSSLLLFSANNIKCESKCWFGKHSLSADERPHDRKVWKSVFGSIFLKMTITLRHLLRKTTQTNKTRQTILHLVIFILEDYFNIIVFAYIQSWGHGPVLCTAHTPITALLGKCLHEKKPVWKLLTECLLLFVVEVLKYNNQGLGPQRRK